MVTITILRYGRHFELTTLKFSKLSTHIMHITAGQKIFKSQGKKTVKSNIFLREIAFLAVLNFFPVQKMIFGHFWNGKKWNLVRKNYMKLIYFISRVFLAWTLKFSGPLCYFMISMHAFTQFFLVHHLYQKYFVYYFYFAFAFSLVVKLYDL